MSADDKPAATREEMFRREVSAAVAAERARCLRIVEMGRDDLRVRASGVALQVVDAVRDAIARGESHEEGREAEGKGARHGEG